MSEIASILHHHEDEICFKVDDVEVFKNLLPLQNAYKQLERGYFKLCCLCLEEFPVFQTGECQSR